MSTLKPFIFGGIASLTAEVGEWALSSKPFDLLLHAFMHCRDLPPGHDQDQAAGSRAAYGWALQVVQISWHGTCSLQNTARGRRQGSIQGVSEGGGREGERGGNFLGIRNSFGGERWILLSPSLCLCHFLGGLSPCSIAPALLRQASYGTLKIGLYHYIKKINPHGKMVCVCVCVCVWERERERDCFITGCRWNHHYKRACWCVERNNLLCSSKPNWCLEGILVEE